MALFFVSVFITVILAKKKPNVIFILSDDLGYDDLQYQSHQINTPNIDHFVNQGQFLAWHYAQSVCSPSRAALMTGRYPLHTGINDWIQPQQTFGVPLNNTMLPEILLQNGYDTHMVGKWHLGMYKWSYTPTYRGYKSYFGYFSGAEDYFTHIQSDYWDFHDCNGINCGPNCCKLAFEVNNTYSTYLFTNRSIEIIKNNSKNNDPLFLYLPYQSVHAPPQVPQSYINPYLNIGMPKQRAVYAGKLSCMDEGVGNITNVLQEYGYLDANNNGSTIIVFQSDNGGPVPNVSANGACNYPLRGGKYSIWEGGSRLSGLIWATKNIVKEELRGRNYSQLMHVVDYYTTLCDAAGINTKDINPKLDGINHWKGLTNSDDTNDKYFKYRDSVYYGYYEKHKAKQGQYNDTAFRYQWYKLFNGSGGNPTECWDCYNFTDGNLKSYEQYYLDYKYDGNPVLLYNLETDAIEKYDISANNTDIVGQIWNMMLQLEATADPTPTPDNTCPSVIPHPDNAWLPWCGEY
eukprot:7321_1